MLKKKKKTNKVTHLIVENCCVCVRVPLKCGAISIRRSNSSGLVRQRLWRLPVQPSIFDIIHLLYL